MAVYRYGEKIPVIGKNTYVSDSARVIGDVTIHDDCYIGHGAVVRADYGTIVINKGCAVEENAVLHIRPQGLLELEDHVTVGHGAIIHGRKIRSHAVIGIGSVIGFDAEIGVWAIVAEGCVIPRNGMVPDGKIAAGVPFELIGDVLQKHRDFWTWGKQLYVDLAKEYPAKFQKLSDGFPGHSSG